MILVGKPTLAKVHSIGFVVHVDPTLGRIGVELEQFHVLISTTSQCDSPDDICSRTYPAYATIMKELAGQSTHGRVSQVDAPHEIYIDNLATVREVIDDVRSRAGG